jgi:hypothetical protein
MHCFDGPDGFDPDNMTDETSQSAMMETMKEAQLEKAKNKKPYLESVFDLVKKAANKNII